MACDCIYSCTCQSGCTELSVSNFKISDMWIFSPFSDGVFWAFASFNSRLNMILVKSSAPLKGMLGSMFGLQQTMGAFARAVSPAFVRFVLVPVCLFFLYPFSDSLFPRNMKCSQLQLLVCLLCWPSRDPQRKSGVACHGYAFDLWCVCLE